jgi:hypothetical protein
VYGASKHEASCTNSCSQHKPHLVHIFIVVTGDQHVQLFGVAGVRLAVLARAALLDAATPADGNLAVGLLQATAAAAAAAEAQFQAGPHVTEVSGRATCYQSGAARLLMAISHLASCTQTGKAQRCRTGKHQSKVVQLRVVAILQFRLLQVTEAAAPRRVAVLGRQRCHK